MDRFPMIITFGGMLLGWIAGTMAVTDPAVLGYLPTTPPVREGSLPEVLDSLRYSAGVAGALLVLALGMLLKRRADAAKPKAP
jgi:predicted tellurium resistance membrane protein TerC